MNLQICFFFTISLSFIYIILLSIAKWIPYYYFSSKAFLKGKMRGNLFVPLKDHHLASDSDSYIFPPFCPLLFPSCSLCHHPWIMTLVVPPVCIISEHLSIIEQSSSAGFHSAVLKIWFCTQCVLPGLLCPHRITNENILHSRGSFSSNVLKRTLWSL